MPNYAVIDSTASLPRYSRLTLTYEQQKLELGEERPYLTIGRTTRNDVVVSSRLASRSHAAVEYRRGRFELLDMSSNGTVLVTANGDVRHVKGERVPLSGRGRFGLGGLEDANPLGVFRYDCK